MEKTTRMRSAVRVYARWLVVFAAAGTLYYLSDRPALPFTTDLFWQSDKVLHFIAYAVFAMLLFRALWADESRATSTGVLLLGVVLATVYGVADEFHQQFVPGREFSLWDMAANGAGASVAAALWETLTENYPWLR